jgi:phospholipid/cholesterol/gamma-HCH transport system substrate-binding protein
MKQSFKFRHADEIAGAFVICAVILFVMAVILAGRSQDWFNGSFKLIVYFNTDDGSFGLQEGAAVQVRNTVAGRVGKIRPTEEGVMGTTFILKERFRPFITKNSVAKVKKKFGVAGDAYIEIERGKGGDVIEDGDIITCVKDEELMDSAQKMLDEFQKQMTPMLEEVEKIVKNAAGILESVDKGEGIAGAVVSDTDLRDNLTQIVDHMEGIADDAEITVSQVGMLLSNNVNSIVGDVTIMTGEARRMFTNDIPQIVAGVPEMQSEMLRIMEESRRLIEAMQRHWLFRKYVRYDSETVPLIPVALGAAANDDLQRKLEKSLNAARLADDTSVISREAYNLAVCRLASGEIDKAAALNTEARLACRTSGHSAASTYLLEAELSRLVHEFDSAAKLVNQAVGLLGKNDKETKVEASIMLAAIYLDSGDIKGAAAELKNAEKLNKKLKLPQYSAAIFGLRAGIALRESRQEDAASYFASQATQLRKTGDFSSMTTALRQAADIYNNIGMQASAAEFYYRSSVSLKAQNKKARAAKTLKLAATAAEASGDELLIKRINQLQQAD